MQETKEASIVPNDYTIASGQHDEGRLSHVRNRK
jgi:hypothetical protein